MTSPAPFPPLDKVPHVRRARPPRPYANWFTPAFESYIRPAHAYPSLWRTFLAMLVGFLVYVTGAFVVLYLFAFWVFEVIDPSRAFELRVIRNAFQQTALPELSDGGTPEAMALMLATFIPIGLAVWVMVRLHRRGFRSLLGPRPGFLRNFAYAFAVVALFHLPFVAYGAFVTGMPGHSFKVPVSVWLFNLSWALPLILIQTSSEELVFRGYLQQQLAVRARNPLIWMLLPSLLFGLGHGNPDTPLEAWRDYVIWATLFGLIAADLTRVTGSLAAAMGMHFANNAFVMLWVGTDDGFGGLALYWLPPDAIGPGPPIWAELVVLLLIWALTRRLLSLHAPR